MHIYYFDLWQIYDISIIPIRYYLMFFTCENIISIGIIHQSLKLNFYCVTISGYPMLYCINFTFLHYCFKIKIDKWIFIILVIAIIIIQYAF